MDTQRKQLELFFRDYDEKFNEGLSGKGLDIEHVVNSFTECFVEASPAGIVCGNREDFRKKIPEGYEFYRKIGIKTMHIVSTSTEVLDNMHVMVKARWKCEFVDRQGTEGSTEFDVRYFLQNRDNTWKIFAYIAGDEQRALKELGLLPEQETVSQD